MLAAAPLLYQCAVATFRAEWGETEAMREGSPPAAPLAHWAEAGVTEFDYEGGMDGWMDGEVCVSEKSDDAETLLYIE